MVIEVVKHVGAQSLHARLTEDLFALKHEPPMNGGSLLVIEHNLDVIRAADWVIDLGPEGGARGGSVVIAGTPETVASTAGSHTGRYLRPLLESR